MLGAYGFEIGGDNSKDEGDEFFCKDVSIEHLFHATIQSTHPGIHNLTILPLFFKRLWSVFSFSTKRA